MRRDLPAQKVSHTELDQGLVLEPQREGIVGSDTGRHHLRSLVGLAVTTTTGLVLIIISATGHDVITAIVLGNLHEPLWLLG